MTVTVPPPGSAPAAAPAAVQPAPAAPRATVSFAQLRPDQQQQFVDQYRLLRVEINQGVEAVKAATQDGVSPEILSSMKFELAKKYQTYQKLGSVLITATKHPDSGLPPSSSAPQLQPRNDASSSVKSEPSTTSLTSNAATSGQTTLPPSMSEPQGLYTSTNMTNNQMYPPEVRAQINKLIGIGQQQQQQQIQSRQENTSPSFSASFNCDHI
jgi:hypothetical protein